MRFKKQIVIVCLFTFLFNGMFFKEKEVKADVLALPISIGVKEVITALLLSAGITITDKYTHNALVQEIYNKRVDEVNNIVAEVQAGNRFSLLEEGKKILETIKKVYNLTYNGELSNKYTLTEKRTFSANTFCPVNSLGWTTVDFNFTSTTRINVQGVDGVLYLPVYSAGSGIRKIKTYVREDKYDYYVSLYVDSNLPVYSNSVSKSVFKQMGIVLDKSAIGTISGDVLPDWEAFREANKDVSINTSALANSSICADDVINWDDTWELDDSQSYPLDKEYGSIVLTPDDVLDKPSVDEMETPTTGDSLWDTLFGFLKSLFAPLTNLLSSIWDLIKKLFEMLKGLLSSILDLLKSLVKSLVDAIAGLFVPTVAFEDIFKDTQKNFIGQIVNFFDFSTLWNIEPKPLEFKIKMPFYDFAKGERVPYEFDIKFF